MTSVTDDTIGRFRQLFGAEPDIIVSAPGRVNLIGEHTDYSDGFVLPVAINRRISVAAGKREDDTISLCSVDLDDRFSTTLDSIAYSRETGWVNYILGVMAQFQSAGHSLHGMNLCIRGNIPIGAGLSSSAALEVSAAMACQALNGIGISQSDIIALSQRAETDFVGVRCGIMDQFMSVMGKRSHAMFLDCRSMEYERIPLPKNFSLIVCDTGIRRRLVDSAYNLRQSECAEATRALKGIYPGVRSLRDVSVEEFAEVESKLPLTPRMRARHVITENARVLEAVRALREGNLDSFGRLMALSHASLRDNFEVSCRELDNFVDIALESSGVFGARMTGAGFGGSGICIVREEDVDSLVDRLRLEYPRRAGRSLTIYVVSTDDGVTVNDLSSSFHHRNPLPA